MNLAGTLDLGCIEVPIWLDASSDVEVGKVQGVHRMKPPSLKR